MNTDQYKHYFLATNRLCSPDEEIVIKLDEPRVYIRYSVEEGMFATYEEFYDSIADVQWIDGNKPDDATVREILTTAWNFLCLDEQLLESDLADMEEEDDF